MKNYNTIYTTEPMFWENLNCDSEITFLWTNVTINPLKRPLIWSVKGECFWWCIEVLLLIF